MRFVTKNEISNLTNLLENVILKREIFLPHNVLTFWKCTYDSVEAINVVFDRRSKRWKGTEVEIALKKLKKRTNKFIRQIKKHGIDHGSWIGASDQCSTMLNSYRSDCIPMLLDLTHILNESDSIRLEIEEVLTV
ncbi:MAG: hypothetical protein ACTSYI_13150 [Promethearchaeota archaeon]